MKSLDEIKNDFARLKGHKSWERFCFLANDNMFAQAVDEIAKAYAEYRTRLLVNGASLIKPLLTSDHLEEHFG
ncbi:hypothetical protein [Taibaiella chishuiensis]|uniref:Uncharacterized protein n=1 Tax=Taibaiella chishuiensis TaxID=1434707 RepID=A0A2P8D4H3_9BACT|nr:hypothetical protein [Taibaiella chishuiensis]PSK92121.1 hypothetical protein B0I18_104219 [Taibaiella chishuiensis]